MQFIMRYSILQMTSATGRPWHSDGCHWITRHIPNQVTVRRKLAQHACRDCQTLPTSSTRTSRHVIPKTLPRPAGKCRYTPALYMHSASTSTYHQPHSTNLHSWQLHELSANSSSWPCIYGTPARPSAGACRSYPHQPLPQQVLCTLREVSARKKEITPSSWLGN